MFGWLTNEVLSAVVQGIVALLGAALLAWAAKYRAEWATPALYGLVGFVLITVAIFLLRLPGLLVRRPKVTQANIEQLIVEWADFFKVSHQRVDQIPEAIFARVFSVGIAQKVIVARLKNRSSLLDIQTITTLSADHQAWFNNLSDGGKEDFLDEFRLEASRGRVAYEIEFPFTKFAVKKALLIRPDLTALEFMSSVDDVAIGAETLRNAVVIGLKKRARPLIAHTAAPQS